MSPFERMEPELAALRKVAEAARELLDLEWDVLIEGDGNDAMIAGLIASLDRVQKTLAELDGVEQSQ